MKAGLALGAMLVLLGGCGDYPRDVAHTSDRVKASGVIRVGLVAGHAAIEAVPLHQAQGAEGRVVAQGGNEVAQGRMQAVGHPEASWGGANLGLCSCRKLHCQCEKGGGAEGMALAFRRFGFLAFRRSELAREQGLPVA